MQSRFAIRLLCLTLAAAVGGGELVSRAQTTGAKSQSKPAAANKKPAQTAGDQGADVPPSPGVFGEVAAVRGNVLQMRTPDARGLTRVILASDAQIIRDEKLKIDALKPGTKVTGTGRPVEGTGADGTPSQVRVDTLEPAGGMNLFAFFGGESSPLLRGREAQVFRKVNYTGNIEFDARVKSVRPLVLTDPAGRPLPVILAPDVEVHQRAPRRIREGDLTAGARLMAMGERTPDGLLKAHMIIMMGAGSERGSLPGTIMAVSARGVTIRPRFQPSDMLIEITPTAKIYNQETLDLDSIQVGDNLAFTGKVIGGTAGMPTALVASTITSANEVAPKIDEGQSEFFGNDRTVTATVKGRVAAFDPLRVQTADGREVTVTVPGQAAYVRYRLLNRAALLAGKKALFCGKTRERGVIADLIILNPSPTLGFSF
jgi:hypothetical protein